MCAADILWIERLALVSMLSTLFLALALLWTHRKHSVPHKSLAVQVICLCAHPYFWLSAEQDCGANLKSSAALFFGLALVSYLWTHYRERLIEKSPSNEHL